MAEAGENWLKATWEAEISWVETGKKTEWELCGEDAE